MSEQPPSVQQHSDKVISRLAALEGRLRAVADERDLLALADKVVDVACQLELTASTRASGPCVVACVGRTRAGKSTLRYVLTGQAEDGLGRGGQRTTLVSQEYSWRELRLFDTPGVGAFEGDDDAAAASETASRADLVLWVVGSDGLQPATIEPVLAMLRRGVPLLVLINHKDTVELDHLSDLPDAHLFPETDARERRLREILGRPDVGIVHAQLDVARSARKHKDSEAWRRSRVPELEKALVDAANHAVAARPDTWAAAVSADLREVAAVVDGILSWVSPLQEKQAADLERLEALVGAVQAAFGREWKSGSQAARRTAEASLRSAARHACVEEHRGKAQDAFSKSLRTLNLVFVRDLEAVVVRATEAAARLLEDVEVGPNTPSRKLVADSVTGQLRGDPLNARTARTVRRVLAVGSGFLVFTPAAPVAWARLAVGLAAPAFVEAVGGSVGPSLEQEQQKREQSVDEAKRRTLKRLAQGEEQASAQAEEMFKSRFAQPLEIAVGAAAKRLQTLLDVVNAAERTGRSDASL